MTEQNQNPLTGEEVSKMLSEMAEEKQYPITAEGITQMLFDKFNPEANDDHINVWVGSGNEMVMSIQMNARINDKPFGMIPTFLAAVMKINEILSGTYSVRIASTRDDIHITVLSPGELIAEHQ